MSATFERFVAGEDGLARLLRALPAFEPPAALAENFCAQARQAQAAHSLSLTFEPPAALEADFLAEAVRIQSAQQARHDAMMSELQAGKSAQEVLGHSVSQATAAWLASQAPVSPLPVASQPRRWQIGWPRVGAVLVSALVGMLISQLWLAQRQDSEPPALLNQPKAQKAAPQADIKLAENTATVSSPSPRASERQAELSSAHSPAEPKAAAVLAKKATQAAPLLRMDFDSREPSSTPESALPTPTPAGAGKAKTDSSGEKNFAKADEPVGGSLKQLAVPPETVSPVEEAKDKNTPAKPASLSGKVELPKQENPPSLPRDAMAAALTVTLESVPAEVAARWLAAGAGRAPRVYSAASHAEAVRDWVERLRLALPEAVRPEQLMPEQDATLPTGVLRLQ